MVKAIFCEDVIRRGRDLTTGGRQVRFPVSVVEYVALVVMRISVNKVFFWEIKQRG